MRKMLHSPWAVIVLALIAPACTSRTTPLPPPEVNNVSRPSEGDVTVVGLALEGASVAVINERTLEGTITTPEQEGCMSVCEFRAVLRADSGDALRVWQFFETEASLNTEVP